LKIKKVLFIMMEEGLHVFWIV